MKLRFWGFTAALVGLLAGCASAPVGSRSFDAGQREAPATGRVGTDSGTVLPYATAPRDERPGLATRWGETRESRIIQTTFRRRDGNDPDQQVQVFYNNRAGLEVMWADAYGKPRLVEDMAARPVAGVEYRFRSGDGTRLPLWQQGGRTFVEGRSGERYALVLRNVTAVRREVVMSVDGLDVLDGAPASLRRRGYVIEPGEEFAVEGFRKSAEQVAAFEFGAVGESYSQLRHGTSRNVGVVGIAVFSEKNEDTERRLDADAFPGRWASPPPR